MAEAYIASISMFTSNFAPDGYLYANGQTCLIQQYQAVYSLIGTVYGGDGASNFKLPDLRGRVPVHYGIVPGSSASVSMGTTMGSAVVTQNLTSMGTLTAQNLPGHTHPASFTANTANVPVPISIAGNQSVNIPVGVSVPSSITPTPLTGSQYLNAGAVGTNLKGVFVNSPPTSTVSLATGGTAGVNLTGSPGVTASPTVNVVTGGSVAVNLNNTGSPTPFGVNGQVQVNVLQPSIGIGFIFCMNGLYPPRP
ncbi:MAG: tail fiber protein [Tagaea sp.]|nr:tail fiber protein [Tagaea sp.]